MTSDQKSVAIGAGVIALTLAVIALTWGHHICTVDSMVWRYTAEIHKEWTTTSRDAHGKEHKTDHHSIEVSHSNSGSYPTTPCYPAIRKSSWLWGEHSFRKAEHRLTLSGSAGKFYYDTRSYDDYARFKPRDKVQIEVYLWYFVWSVNPLVVEAR